MTKTLIDTSRARPADLTRFPDLALAPVTVNVLEDRAAREFLTAQWPSLYEQTLLATPYQSPDWLGVHADLLSSTAVLQVVAAETEAGIRAALALVQDRSISGRMEVTPLSAPEAEYIRLVGPDAEHPAVAAAIAQALTPAKADIILPDVPANSALGRHIAQWQQALTRCAQMQLPVDYAALSRSTRREHRRRMRDWNELVLSGHAVTYRRISRATDLLDAYAVLCDLRRRRWAASPPEHCLTSTEERFRTVLRRCSHMAFIATLALDGDVVAGQLCLHRGRHAYSLLPAMDPAHLDLAPGHALLRRLAADLADSGYSTLDLGRTTSAPGQLAYKSQYGPTWTATLTAARRAAGPLPRKRGRGCSLPSGQQR